MAFVETQIAIPRERFSLLLLEPGEIYFEDFSAFCEPVLGVSQRMRGRLKICSKSVIFDPKDVQYPILKFLYRDVAEIKKWESPSDSYISEKSLMLETEQVIDMKAGDHIAPYNFKRERRKYLFTLEFSHTDDCVPQMCQLHRASTLPISDQTAMISAIVAHRQDLVQFNKSWLESLYEDILYESQCDKINPLVINPGRVMLTSERLYFQPFNNIDPRPVLKIKHAHLNRICKRRFLLRNIGLEIWCREESEVGHIYLAFKSAEARDALFHLLLQQPKVELENLEQENMTLKWQSGAVSNFDYLIYLNSLADRSINDLTQYPVFPWVIKDFTSTELDLDDPNTYRDLSKPVGALNDERLHKLLERFQEMPEPRFLYGSHYSTPGYVLYYLVRSAPEYMLCLQSGRFDQPDRMFNSLSDAWKNCQTSYSDFKELVPEFYHGDGNFLLNSQNVVFGVRQDGTTVEDVSLPPWARDPQDFVAKMRSALECERVSEHLHQWIDLVFGYKQKGLEAEKAHNLFFYLTYEGAIDLESIVDLNERAALEQQIMEFGQTPKQLFTKPHVGRPSHADIAIKNHKLFNNACSAGSSPPPHDHKDGGVTPQTNEDPGVPLIDSGEKEEGGSVTHRPDVWQEVDRLRVTCRYDLHKAGVTGVRWSDDGDVVYSIDQDGCVKLYSCKENQQLRSFKLSNMCLSCLVVLEDMKTLLFASWDNHLYLYSLEFGRVLDECFAHDDAISDMCLSEDKLTLVTSSWDSTVKLWDCGKTTPTARCKFTLKGEMDHDTGVSCVRQTRDGRLVVTATREGALTVWDSQGQQALHSAQAHQGDVCQIQLSGDDSRVLSVGEDGVIQITEIANGARIFSKYRDSGIRCIVWNDHLAIAGTSTGVLEVWDVDKTVLLHTLTTKHTGGVSCLSLHPQRGLATGGEKTQVCVLTTQKP